jgi:hypothetical protein
MTACYGAITNTGQSARGVEAKQYTTALYSIRPDPSTKLGLPLFLHFGSKSRVRYNMFTNKNVFFGSKKWNPDICHHRLPNISMVSKNDSNFRKLAYQPSPGAIKSHISVRLSPEAPSPWSAFGFLQRCYREQRDFTENIDHH